MCRLFAYKNKRQGDTKLLIRSLKEFLSLSETGFVPNGIEKGHRDGFGILCYKNGKIIMDYKTTKDPLKTGNEQKFIFNKIKRYKPDIVLCHLRKKTSGSLSIKNTQPFSKGNISFMHNGTVFFNDMKENDSTILFNKITNGGLENLKVTIQSVERDFEYRAMNSIISDGSSLIAIKYWNTNYGGKEGMNLKKYYSLFTIKNNFADIVCSEILPSLTNSRIKNTRNKSFTIL